MAGDLPLHLGLVMSQLSLASSTRLKGGVAASTVVNAVHKIGRVVIPTVQVPGSDMNFLWAVLSVE
jgi:hypothetical protein